jgi:hypothetical protein
MKNPQPELCCSLCHKRVTLREDTCIDENGKAVHTDCFANQILQHNGQRSGTAA